jgi:hypothetical protein
MHALLTLLLYLMILIFIAGVGLPEWEAQEGPSISSSCKCQCVCVCVCVCVALPFISTSRVIGIDIKVYLKTVVFTECKGHDDLSYMLWWCRMHS